MSWTARREPTAFTDVVLVCAKCAAKLGRGRKHKTELRGQIKKALKDRGLGGRIGVVETGCLDLCPNGAQTIATARQLCRGELTVVPAAATGEAVVKVLFDAGGALVETLGPRGERFKSDRQT